MSTLLAFLDLSPTVAVHVRVTSGTLMIFNLAGRNVVVWGVIVEGGMLLAALSVGWLVGVDPLGSITSQSANANLVAVAQGLFMGTALFGVGWLLVFLPWAPLQRFEAFMRQQVTPLFSDLSWGELALISALAGIGEEALFRGLIQTGITHWIDGPAGWLWGLAISSVLFGVCHALNRMYLFLATVMGIIFAGLLIYFDNLLVCMVAHGWYDFVMLLFLIRQRERSHL